MLWVGIIKLELKLITLADGKLGEILADLQNIKLLKS